MDVGEHRQQESADDDQACVGGHAEALEGFGAAPAGQGDENDGKGADLAGFDADVEGENLAQEVPAFADRQCLEAGGEAEAVNQAKQSGD